VVRPARSAVSRNAAAPACAITASPSAVTVSALGPSGRVVHAKSASRHGVSSGLHTQILPDQRHFSLSTRDTPQQDRETPRYEGAVVAGYPTDATDDAVQASIVAAGYR
jgi:hypothetical protein